MRPLATLLILILTATCSPRTWEVESGVFDLAQVGSDPQLTRDLATYWTRGADPVHTEGCDSRMGWPVSTDVAACPSVLQRTADFFRACAPGWNVCAAQPLPPGVCRAMPWGAFVGLATGYQPGPLPQVASMTCGWPTSGTGTRVLFACGQGLQDASIRSCGGFEQMVDCTPTRGTGSAWNCPSAGNPGPEDLIYTTNMDPRSGVLCCRA